MSTDRPVCLHCVTGNGPHHALPDDTDPNLEQAILDACAEAITEHQTRHLMRIVLHDDTEPTPYTPPTLTYWVQHLAAERDNLTAVVKALTTNREPTVQAILEAIDDLNIAGLDLHDAERIARVACAQFTTTDDDEPFTHPIDITDAMIADAARLTTPYPAPVDWCRMCGTVSPDRPHLCPPIDPDHHYEGLAAIIGTRTFALPNPTDTQHPCTCLSGCADQGCTDDGTTNNCSGCSHRRGPRRYEYPVGGRNPAGPDEDPPAMTKLRCRCITGHHPQPDQQHDTTHTKTEELHALALQACPDMPPTTTLEHLVKYLITDRDQLRNYYLGRDDA
jgi:hypothetical protein